MPAYVNGPPPVISCMVMAETLMMLHFLFLLIEAIKFLAIWHKSKEAVVQVSDELENSRSGVTISTQHGAKPSLGLRLRPDE